LEKTDYETTTPMQLEHNKTEDVLCSVKILMLKKQGLKIKKMTELFIGA